MEQMINQMGEERFAEFLSQASSNGMPEELIAALMAKRSAKSGAPQMELYHSSTKTISIKVAATEGEVTPEAVQYQIKKGTDGIKLLEDAACAAKCESMYHNVETILQEILEAKMSFSSSLAFAVMGSSDIWSRTLEGVQNYINRFSPKKFHVHNNQQIRFELPG